MFAALARSTWPLMPGWWRARFSAWIERRLLAVPQLRLSHREIFIFPSRGGWLFIVVGLLILVGASNYQNNLGLVLAFWLCSLGVLAKFLSFRNLLGIQVRAGDPPPAFVGESIAFPIWLEDPDGRAHAAVSVSMDGNSEEAHDVPSQSAVCAELQVPAVRRGWQTMPRFCLQSLAPFGWLRVWSWPKLTARALVYPMPIEPPWPLQPQGEGDGKHAKPISGSEDFAGHRLWRQGDSLRQVDWKAYARERGLHLRQFIAPSGDEWWFRLRDLPAADRETQLSWLCFLLLEAEHKGQRYGLELSVDKFAPDQGDVHLHRCLKALALYGHGTTA